MNEIMLHGRLTDDVQCRDYTTQKGKTDKMSTFCVAVAQRWGDNTNYFDCSCFGKVAEIVASHFHKGQEIIVRGEMNSRVVEKDGQKRKYWTVNVDQFDFCGKKEEGFVDADDAAPF